MKRFLRKFGPAAQRPWQKNLCLLCCMGIFAQQDAHVIAWKAAARNSDFWQVYACNFPQNNNATTKWNAKISLQTFELTIRFSVLSVMFFQLYLFFGAFTRMRAGYKNLQGSTWSTLGALISVSEVENIFNAPWGPQYIENCGFHSMGSIFILEVAVKNRTRTSKTIVFNVPWGPHTIEKYSGAGHESQCTCCACENYASKSQCTVRPTVHRKLPPGTLRYIENFRQAPRSTSKMRAGREQIHRSLVIQRQLSISWRLAPCLIHASCVCACLQSKQG